MGLQWNLVQTFMALLWRIGSTLLIPKCFIAFQILIGFNWFIALFMTRYQQSQWHEHQYFLFDGKLANVILLAHWTEATDDGKCLSAEHQHADIVTVSRFVHLHFIQNLFTLTDLLLSQYNIQMTFNHFFIPKVRNKFEYLFLNCLIWTWA